MNQKLTNILKLAAVTLPLGLAACASTTDMQTISARVDKAQSTADQAMSKAGTAQSSADQATNKANDAMRTAEEAMRKADQAVQTANDAKAAADQANEKLNRMFKKSMEK